MFRRKAVVNQGVCEEKSVYDCLNKLIAAQTKVSEQQLRWAKAEENPLFLCLFGCVAELGWMGNELIRQFQDKQTELNRVFRDIEQEDRIVDETRKALLACKTKYLKLQKQLEHSRKKNDAAKIQSIEVELTTQGSLQEHLRESVETQSHRLELYKIDLVKKGLKGQAQTYLDILLNYQTLFNAQLQLADMLCLQPTPSSPASPHEERDTNVSEEMRQFVCQVTDNLRLYPPKNGGINVKKLSEASQSPPIRRRSSAEELLLKMQVRGKTQHSISQPILVGHNQNGPLEDGAVLNLVPAALVAAGAKDHTVDDGATTISGEYCVIDHTPPGIPEETERDDNGHTQTTESRRSPQDLQRTQSGHTSHNASPYNSDHLQQQQQQQQQQHKTAEIGSVDSINSNSVEDLTSGKESERLQDMSGLEGDGSDECYADPVDAINEFLQGGDNVTAESPPAAEPTSIADSSTKLTSAELLVQQHTNKELQLQLFHERLLKKDISASQPVDLDKDLGACDGDQNDYSEVEDEPTYSNPFDALAENAFRSPYRVGVDKLKRNVSMSSSAPWTVQKHPVPSGVGRLNSPPPPPLPLKDEKLVGIGRRPPQYGRRGSGENEGVGGGGGGGGGSPGGNNSSASPVQQQVHPIWERRELVWKRKNSNRATKEDSVSTGQRVVVLSDDEKPEPPVSVAERLRQLRQRSHSDGVTLDEARLLARPPMPLPIPEQEPGEGNRWGQVRLNGQAHHMAHTANRGTKDSKQSPVLDMANGREQKVWLERTASDQQCQSVYYAKRGMAHVVPLSAQEIVQQHISHVA